MESSNKDRFLAGQPFMVTGRNFGVFTFRMAEWDYVHEIIRHLSAEDEGRHVCAVYLHDEQIECFVCPLGQVFTWFHSFDDFRFDNLTY